MIYENDLEIVAPVHIVAWRQQSCTRLNI